MFEPTVFWTNPFTVNVGNTTGNQSHSTPIGLSDGRILIVWVDGNNNVDSDPGTDIIAQFYDAEGIPTGQPFQLNDFGVNDFETDPTIVALPNGGFVVAYEQNGSDTDTDILVEEYDANGNLVRDFLAASGAAGADAVRNLTIITYPLTNDYTIVFERLSVGDNDIRAVTLDGSAGTLSSEFDAAQNGTDFDRVPDSAAFAGGNFVTVCEEDDAGDTSIEFHIRSASGIFQTQGQSTNDGSDPHVAVLSNTNFVITWTTSSGGIMAEIRDSSGNIVRDNFAVADFLFHGENSSDVVALADGGFFITYHDSVDNRLEVARFDVDGNLVGARLIIDTDPNISNPELALLSDGRVLISWENSSDIFSAIIDTRDGIIVGTGLVDALTSRPEGVFVFGLAGDDEIFGHNGVDFLSGSIGADTIHGGNSGDLINGDEGEDILFGDQGADTINGGGGDDTIDGGLSSGDVLNGGDGNDIILGGYGNDMIDGGDGHDTVDYSGFGGNITVNLTNNGSPQTAGGAGVDVIINVESIIGGDFADRLTGTTGVNSIVGGSGSDRIFGLGGDDVLQGEGGNDLIQGGNENDFILGGDGQDQINGGEGNDTVVGASTTLIDDNATDRLTGADGNDRLVGGGGRDILRGDSFIGGTSVTGGSDIFDFNDVNDSLAGGLRDIIRDFVQGEDLIDLLEIDAIMGGADDAFNFIGTGGFTNTAGEIRYPFGGSHTIISADVDGDGIADFQIDLNGNISLLDTDFIL